jgi:hypothetical protein
MPVYPGALRIADYLERQSLQGEQSMADDSEAKEVIFIQGVACRDGRAAPSA